MAFLPPLPSAMDLPSLTLRDHSTSAFASFLHRDGSTRLRFFDRSLSIQTLLFSFQKIVFLLAYFNLVAHPVGLPRS
jgi:hypothetical protein